VARQVALFEKSSICDPVAETRDLRDLHFGNLFAGDADPFGIKRVGHTLRRNYQWVSEFNDDVTHSYALHFATNTGRKLSCLSSLNSIHRTSICSRAYWAVTTFRFGTS
jgi:hypothetical protein